METLYCRIYGRVQLVMMRDFVTRKARKLQLVGYVRNLKDGSVEAYAEGDRAAIERWIQYLNGGSVLARVERVDAQWGGAPASDIRRQSFDSFDIVF